MIDHLSVLAQALGVTREQLVAALKQVAAQQQTAAQARDMTNQYNTALTPAQEQQFQAWKASLPPQLQSSADYDLRKAWLVNAQEAANGHLTDIGKKPNHMTFSTESAYSTPQAPGGTWSQIGPESAENPNGVWQFDASPTNLQYHSPDDLLNYFQAVENNAREQPDGSVRYGTPNKVVLPPGTR